MSLLFSLKCPILNCSEEQFGTCDTRGCKCNLSYCSKHIAGNHQLRDLPNYGVAGTQLNAGVTGNQLRGLPNFGNTCYLNCIVQSLVANTSLSKFFTEDAYRELHAFDFEEHSITKAYAGLVKSLYLQQNEQYAPDECMQIFHQRLIILYPEYIIGNVHDCNEFLYRVLNRLDEEIKQLKQAKCVLTTGDASKAAQLRSVIRDIFEGQLHCDIKCLTCEHMSRKYEPFKILELAIPDGAGPFRIDHLISKFCEEEFLDFENKYNCPTCKKYQLCSKQITIDRMPVDLILSFKRFKDYRLNAKINTLILYPESLNLCYGIYNLNDVSSHIGASRIEGHYISRCWRKGTWNTFDDEKIVTSFTLDTEQQRDLIDNVHKSIISNNDANWRIDH